MFTVSKIFWWAFEPANLFLITLVFFCLLSYLRGYHRVGRSGVAVATIVAVLISALPIGFWILRPLEQRFPAVEQLPTNVTGMISVGGAVNQFRTADRNQVALTGQAERLTQFVALARRYPQLRLLYTGGSGSLKRQDLKEADVARRFFAEMGLDPARVIYEDRSRNTYENAIYSASILRPSGGSEVWALITSAIHMPRTVGVFRKAGFTVLPYPVDYLTGDRAGGYGAGLLAGFNSISKGFYEWSGLIAYRLLGRTDNLLPKP